MDFLSGAVRRTKEFMLKHPFLCGLYAVIFLLFLINARYVDYPDEFVNLIAGKSILHFGLPYKDAWDHHLPGAWYLSAPLLLISGGSYALFRLWWAVATFIGFLIVSYIIRHEEPRLHRYFLVFFFVYPMAALYFWFHLYLADSLAIYFFSLAFWLLIDRTIHPAKTLRSLYIMSILIFAMIFSSATFVYMGAVLYLWLAYLVVFPGHHRTEVDSMSHEMRMHGPADRHWKSTGVSLLRVIGVSFIPYVLYIIVLLVTGTLKDFYFANFVYNTTLYISIPNYVRGTHFNPAKFAMTIIANFYGGYLPLLSKIKYFDLYLPIGTLAGLSTLTLLLLLLSRSWILGVLYFLLLSFSAPRSDIQSYKETDYQSGMFIVFGLLSTMTVLYLLRAIENRGLISDMKRLSRLIIGVFLLFTIIFLSYNSYSKAFQIYTQKLPTLHNRGEANGFIDEFTSPGDYYFIGPYEPNESFFVKNARFPGKYVSLLPQFRESDFVKSDFLSQFEQHPPKFVLFRQQSSIFGTPALVFGKFLYDWMTPRYTALEKVPGVQVLRQPTRFDLRTDLFIRNDVKDEMLKAMVEKGYISYAPAVKNQPRPIR